MVSCSSFTKRGCYSSHSILNGIEDRAVKNVCFAATTEYSKRLCSWIWQQVAARWYPGRDKDKYRVQDIDHAISARPRRAGACCCRAFPLSGHPDHSDHPSAIQACAPVDSALTASQAISNLTMGNNEVLQAVVEGCKVSSTDESCRVTCGGSLQVDQPARLLFDAKDQGWQPWTPGERSEAADSCPQPSARALTPASICRLQLDAAGQDLL